MLISVIVTVYNTASYLQKCLDSLLNAENGMDNHEIILVNDGSTDESLKICQKYADEHKHITLLSQENQGLPGAKIKGLSRASGEFVTFVDSDDYVENNYFQVFNATLDRYPKEDILGFNYFKTHGTEQTYKRLYGTFEKVLTHSDILEMLKSPKGQGFLLYTPTKLYRRSLINPEQFFDRKISLGEDTLFNLFMFYYAESVVFIDKALYNYCYNPNSLTSQKYKRDLVPKMERHFSKKLGFYHSKKELYEKEYFKNIARINLENTFFAFVGNILANKDLKFIEEIKKIRETELINFGFRYYRLRNITDFKMRITLWLFKYRFYRFLNIIYVWLR